MIRCHWCRKLIDQNGNLGIKTGLLPHNVTRVRPNPAHRAQYWASRRIGADETMARWLCGSDGEDYVMVAGTNARCKREIFLRERRSSTFTYCKPLMMHLGQPPSRRLDSKNWHPTPVNLQHQLANAVRSLTDQVDAIIVLDQVDTPGGVVTQSLLDALARLPKLHHRRQPRGLKDWPSIIYKMNAAELAQLTDQTSEPVKAARVGRTASRPVLPPVNTESWSSPDGRSESRPLYSLRRD